MLLSYVVCDVEYIHMVCDIEYIYTSWFGGVGYTFSWRVIQLAGHDKTAVIDFSRDEPSHSGCGS